MSQRECQARWYESHKEEHISNCIRRRKEQEVYNQNYVIQYLLNHSCIDCGETDIVVLQFDHVRGSKRTEIARMMCFSNKSLIREIEKCEVRCANCHFRKTAQRLNNYRVQWVAGVSGNIPPS